MKANYSTYITRAVVLLILFFFLAMMVYGRKNPLVTQDVQHGRSFPKPSQYSQPKLSNTIISLPYNT